MCVDINIQTKECISLTEKNTDQPTIYLSRENQATCLTLSVVNDAQAVTWKGHLTRSQPKQEAHHSSNRPC